MMNVLISFYDAPPVAVTIGQGEDVKAPRDLRAMEQDGWVIDEAVEVTYKAFMAGRRIGAVDKEAKFDEWVDTVKDLDLRPSAKQIDAAVALGTMTAEQGANLKAYLESNDEGASASEGEGAARPGE